jgi:hypothetical protein
MGNENRNLSDLKLNRRNIKSSIIKLQNGISNSENDIYQLQTDLETVTDLFKQYNSVQFEVEKIQFSQEGSDEQALEQESDKERGKIETQYRAIVSKIKSLLVCNNSSSSTSTVINITNDGGAGARKMNDNINLKPLPLPIFTGKHSEWFAFYESFKCLVGDDANISDICKFHYLKGCLKEESLSISGENYMNAINVLRKRFENKRLIVNQHVTNILNIQPLLKSSFTELRTLIDTVNNNIAALKVLQYQPEHWDPFLVPIILEKLHFVSKKGWQARLDKDVPTYNSFNDFLEKRYQILEAMSDIRSNETKFRHAIGNKT